LSFFLYSILGEPFMKHLKLAILTLLLPLAVFAQPPEFTGATSLDGIVGKNESFLFLSDQSVYWNVEDALPGGFSMEPWCTYPGSYYCLISGTPTTVGTFTFTLGISNPNGSATETFTLDVKMPDAPTIQTSTLPNGTMGEYYEEVLLADEYAEWSIVSGSLPLGIELSDSLIIGTPIETGTFTFTVKAENITDSDTKALSITIDPEQNAPGIIQYPTPMPDGEEEQYYDSQGQYFYSDRAAKWSITNGSLPPGLSLEHNNYSKFNRIIGTATTAGTYNFTVSAENEIGSDYVALTIKINAQPAPQFTFSYVKSEGFVDEYFDISDGQFSLDRNANWSITNGILPPGLSLSYSSNSSYNYISGSPTTVGTYSFSVRISNSGGSNDMPFTIEIKEPPVPQITTGNLLSGTVGKSESFSFNSDQSATWSVEDALPNGFSMQLCSMKGCSISGTPAKAGTFTFTLKVENSHGSSTKTFTLDVRMPDAPTIQTSTLSNGTMGENYYRTLTASEYAEWSIVSGSLPSGLELLYGGGVTMSVNISGTPTKAGIFTFTVEARNITGNDTKQFTITIGTEQLPPVLNYYYTPSVYVGEDIQISIYSDRAANWSINGDPSLGFMLEHSDYSSDNRIFGTPIKAGTYTFIVRVANGIGYDERPSTITVSMPSAPLQIIDPAGNLLTGTVGINQLEFTSSQNVKWSVEGSLPQGLELEDNGYNMSARIKGVLVAAGIYNFTLKVTNMAGNSTTKTFTLDVAMPDVPEIQTSTLPSGTMGEEYCVRMTGMCYESAYLKASVYAEWNIISGKLPDGLRLDSDGEVWGTPSKSGTYTFTAMASNLSGSDTKSFSITIDAEPLPPVFTYTYIPPSAYMGQDFDGEVYLNRAANWSISGTLPPGLALEKNGYSDWAYIYGKPTKAGTYTFTLKATNSVGSVEKIFTINIITPPEPEFATTSMPKGIVDISYNKWVSLNNPAEISLASGNLPPGLELSNDGNISGTPIKAGTYTFTAMATNVAGISTQQLSITIEESPFVVVCITGGDVWENGICRAKTPAESCKEGGDVWDNGTCRPKTPAEVCVSEGDVWASGICRAKTLEERRNECLANSNRVWENDLCRSRTSQEICVSDGKTWESNRCVSPIRLPQIANIGNILAYAIGKTIVLQNLPNNAKVEVFGLNGKLVYSNRGNPSIGVQTISVQTKGIYIVKVSFGSEIKTLKVAIK
jgi:PKD repeat protein